MCRLFLIKAHPTHGVCVYVYVLHCMLLQAVKMTSVKTQLPYEYYTLPFCQPVDGNVQYKSLNLGKSCVVCCRQLLLMRNYDKTHTMYA